MEYEMYDNVYSLLHDPPSYMLKRKDMKLKDVVKENLLPFLPAKTLTQFTLVSKEWNQWIKSPLLAHHQSYYFNELSGFFCQNNAEAPNFVSLKATDYGVPKPSLGFLPERVDILSSCKGLLVCHGRDGDELYYICNPANKEWTPLPKPHLYHGFGSRLVLAFEPSARNIEGNYNLVCAVPMRGLVYFELYTSSTRSWTILNVILVEMDDLRIEHGGFYMKGVTYWVTNTRKVIAIDVEKEVYEVIPLPRECLSDGVLTQIRGELCYITMSHVESNRYSVMINGGMDLSLIHNLELNLGEIDGILWQRFMVLPCFDGEKVVILFGDRIYSFDINDEILTEIACVGAESADADKFVAYVNSLVQLH